jgi:hypothetical protein
VLPVLWLTLDEAASGGDRTFLDASPSAIVASCAAASCPASPTGATGTPYAHFTGAEFLDLGTQLGQAFPELSITAWVRNPSQHLLERGVWDDEDGFGLVFQATPQFGHWFGAPAFYVYNLPVVSPVNVSDGQWHHVVGTMAPAPGGNTEWKIYTDGTLSASVLDTRIITNSAAPTTVGRRWNQPRFYAGDVCHLSVWDHALTAAEVASLHMSTSFVTAY